MGTQHVLQLVIVIRQVIFNVVRVLVRVCLLGHGTQRYLLQHIKHVFALVFIMLLEHHVVIIILIFYILIRAGQS